MNLLTPITLGAVSLENRVLMAPLTRMRADNEGVPSPMAIEYYAQRASAGLIISEATQISELGKGYPATPGIYSEPQEPAKLNHGNIPSVRLLISKTGEGN